MNEISRRHFLTLSALLPFLVRRSALAVHTEGDRPSVVTFPRTKAVLQQSFRVEMIAYRHYLEYTSKALEEKYPNIAYLFYSFSFSEKIHADNYKRILTAVGCETEPAPISIEVHDTKSNLRKAAQNELMKIQKIYPDFLRELETESCEEAIVGCMYSWKSHQQHEEAVAQIGRYSGMFFSSVSGKIEGMDLDFHVCRVCGSTINKVPDLPCAICNRPKSNYQRIMRPA